MTPMRKRGAVLVVLVGGALLVERLVALANAGTEVVEPVRQGPAGVAARVPAPAPTLDLERLAARRAWLAKDAAPRSPFEATAWPAAAASRPPEPPPKPVAPAFPYAYMGALVDEGVQTAFFVKGERVLPVKAGDTVDGAYRVDRLDEKQMTLTYLPLNEAMLLPLGRGR
ncbi:MAG TPA: hypothetical protein VLI72_10590 [Methylibium sp.]|nr:hypothetical protein [Methylibium sp.]